LNGVHFRLERRSNLGYSWFMNNVHTTEAGRDEGAMWLPDAGGQRRSVAAIAFQRRFASLS